jgi:hypothetical protein
MPRKMRSWQDRHRAGIDLLIVSCFESITFERRKSHIAIVTIKELESGGFEVLDAKEMSVELLQHNDKARRSLALSQIKKEIDYMYLVVKLQVVGIDRNQVVASEITLLQPGYCLKLSNSTAHKICEMRPLIIKGLNEYENRKINE